MKLTDEEILALAKSISISVDYEEFCLAMNYQEILAFAHAIADLTKEADAEICESQYQEWNGEIGAMELRPCFDTPSDCATAIRATKGEPHD